MIASAKCSQKCSDHWYKWAYHLCFILMKSRSGHNSTKKTLWFVFTVTLWPLKQVWANQSSGKYHIKMLDKLYVKQSESLVKNKIDISISCFIFILTYSQQLDVLFFLCQSFICFMPLFCDIEDCFVGAWRCILHFLLIKLCTLG